jgi:ribosome maturation factor RimP
MDRQLISTLWALIEPVLEPDGFELVELEYKLEAGRWTLRLYVDVENGISLDQCESVSRQVGALLDIKDPMPRAYVLEVSSPGVNRVLRKAGDFERFAGSPAKIRTETKIDGRRNFQGVLRGMRGACVALEVSGAVVEIPLDTIDKARLDLPASDLFRESLKRGASTTRNQDGN